MGANGLTPCVPSGATRVDLSGKTVMSAVVNAHMHLAIHA